VVGLQKEVLDGFLKGRKGVTHGRSPFLLIQPDEALAGSRIGMILPSPDRQPDIGAGSVSSARSEGTPPRMPLAGSVQPDETGANDRISVRAKIDTAATRYKLDMIGRKAQCPGAFDVQTLAQQPEDRASAGGFDFANRAALRIRDPDGLVGCEADGPQARLGVGLRVSLEWFRACIRAIKDCQDNEFLRIGRHGQEDPIRASRRNLRDRTKPAFGQPAGAIRPTHEYVAGILGMMGVEYLAKKRRSRNDILLPLGRNVWKLS